MLTAVLIPETDTSGPFRLYHALLGMGCAFCSICLMNNDIKTHPWLLAFLVIPLTGYILWIVDVIGQAISRHYQEKLKRLERWAEEFDKTMAQAETALAVDDLPAAKRFHRQSKSLLARGSERWHPPPRLVE